MRIKHIDLFSGIGGFAYAIDHVWDNVEHTFVEIAPYCQQLLKKRFKGATIHGDIRTFTNTNNNGFHGCKNTKSGSEREAHYKERENKICEFKRGNTLWSKVDILTGGFPCQPFSQAGQRRGKEDDRYLWPEMLRVIKEFNPTWIVGENVAGITNMAQQQNEIKVEGEADNDEEDNQSGDSDGILYEIIASLEQLNYAVQTFVIPACAVNAPHRRDRVWIIAHNKSKGWSEGVRQEIDNERWQMAEFGQKWSGLRQNVRTSNKYTTDTSNQRLQRDEQQETFKQREGTPRPTAKLSWDENWLKIASELCGVDDGLPAELDGFKLSKAGHRVERLKSLGNSIVPQVVMEIFKHIAVIEGGID